MKPYKPVKRPLAGVVEHPKPNDPKGPSRLKRWGAALKIGAATGLLGASLWMAGKVLPHEKHSSPSRKANTEMLSRSGANTSAAAKARTNIVSRNVAVSESQIASFYKVYKMSPTNKVHSKTMGFIQEISRSIGVSPKDVMITIERNIHDSSQLWAIDNAMRSASAQGKTNEVKRMSNVRQIVESVLTCKDKEIKAQLESMTRVRGTLDKVRSLKD
ncbi:MAG: hypothetical protein AABW59_01450 [archaeon]